MRTISNDDVGGSVGFSRVYVTAQEIFDTVAVHLLKQGRISTGRKTAGQCAYRGDDELQCAIGCLIRDEEYSPSMEGQTIGLLTWKYPSLKRLRPHLPLLLSLQKLHDHDVVDSWRDGLWSIANKFELSKEALPSC